MKRIVIALSVALVATFAIAQEPPCIMKHSHGAGRDSIVTALNLSTDQKVQWDAIHQQLEASVKPLFEQHQTAEQQLNAATEASNPDATAVGRAYLALQAVGKQIKDAHLATKSKIDAILTPDQKAKFDAIHADMEHGGPGQMMKMRHLEGMHE
jgi:Spy/CpxP family protein refolding chaperone